MTDTLERIAFGDPVAVREEQTAHDEVRFAALVERHSRFVFRVAYSVLRNIHDSEDVVQETFLKLFRSGRWRDIDEERAFLARSAWRNAIDRRRKPAGDPPAGDVPSGERNPEESAIEKDTKIAVRRLIDALPEELRLPLALSTVDEMKSHEIAAIMGIPEGTVRSRLARARQILREKLAVLLGRHE